MPLMDVTNGGDVLCWRRVFDAVDEALRSNCCGVLLPTSGWRSPDILRIWADARSGEDADDNGENSRRRSSSSEPRCRSERLPLVTSIGFVAFRVLAVLAYLRACSQKPVHTADGSHTRL